MKPLTPSVYTFEDLILGDYLYVDKTEYLWQLVKQRKGIYFLSRPRRFGKSLTLSTLKAIFQGKRELFKGLAMDSKPYDWKAYPIIHLSFADCDAGNAQELEDYLHDQVNIIAREKHIQLSEKRLSSRFQTLIASMDNGSGVVVLVDEYDKPLLNNLGNVQATWEMLPVMKGFYSVIKQCNEQERFVFVTGVTKFCHVSLFSDLNNLQDISRSPAFATMLGYTQRELETNFAEKLDAVETLQAIEHDMLLASLKAWYDGYRFAPKSETVYNPVSIANFFINDGDFANYWYATGTTSSLFQMMRQSRTGLPEIMEGASTAELFESFDLAAVDIRKLMYQTGYLTIGDTEPFAIPGMPGVRQCRYYLRFPNYEVKHSFNNQVMEHYAGLRAAQSLDLTRQLVDDVQNGDVDAFLNRLKILFARIPYNLHGRQEHDFQTIIYVIFMMLNVYIEAEHHTSDGRIDLVLKGEKWLYVIELKLNGTAERAMKQIQNRDYARGFLGQGRRVIAVGVNFNAKKAQIDNWLVEEVQQ